MLWGPPEGRDAFERYYAETHTALATPDAGAVPYQRTAELTFEDMGALQAGFGSEQGRRPSTTSRTFATGGVTIFFAEID